jgi:hypothetical protein
VDAIKLFFLRIFTIAEFFTYCFYDFLVRRKLKLYKEFFGWGIHLYTGRFGSGKTITMCQYAYKLCVKYPQLSILTNLNLDNFPEHTRILHLNHAIDILNAPRDTLVLIDEIGTIFNSRDFSSGQKSVPKSLFQHLCQCRKRNMVILGTVQKYNLLDKQIRDISADVNVCVPFLSHPYTRSVKVYTYDVDEYDMYMSNRMYNPLCLSKKMYIQTNLYRNLYNTEQLIDNMLKDDYISDDEILKNRAFDVFSVEGNKRQKNKVKFKR